MANHDDVTYAWSSIRRTLGSVADWGMFLLFKPADSGSVPEDEVVAAVDRAIAAANETVPSRTIVGGVALRAVPGVAATLFWDGQDGTVIRPWLTAFTDHLQADGLSGKVGGSGQRLMKLEGRTDLNSRFPTAFVGYRLVEYRPPSGSLSAWGVDPATTRRIAESRPITFERAQ